MPHQFHQIFALLHPGKLHETPCSVREEKKSTLTLQQERHRRVVNDSEASP